MLKPLPVGIQTFRDIIEGGFVYVDKTRWVYEMVRYPKGVYFLARPRRFGKSLLISTLAEIFAGNRELFKGLWIYDADFAWTPHPVIRVDFSLDRVHNAEELKEVIAGRLLKIAAQHGVEIRRSRYQWAFQDLIEALSARGKVVVLIDEYDKPLLDNLGQVEEAKRIREVLKGFYIVLKGMDEYLRFVFLTGVSKFSKVGVFSGLNNLADITMDDRYATMLGITQEELERDLAAHVDAFARDEKMEREALLAEIGRWYDGFCFSQSCRRVYNPFSLLRLLDARQFQNYWFETGTPTFLVELIKRERYGVEELDNLEVSELAFSAYEVEDLRALPLLFQTGYLTIKGYDRRRRLYRLGYPNREVEEAFSQYLLGAFGAVDKGRADAYLWRLVDALEGSDLEEFFAILEVFFADIPYDIQIRRERYYQTVFYLIFKLLGLKVEAEARTGRGRIDAVVEVGSGVYIFEFKLEGSEEDALRQIEERDYATR